jgi:hypothetical protein
VIVLCYALQDPGGMRRRWLPAAAIFAIAPMGNPYGWRLYEHVYRYLTDSALLARIGEFQSFDFHAPGAGQILTAVILGMFGGGLALAQRRWHHALLAVLFTAMELRSARALPLAALILLPVANGATTGWLKEIGLEKFVAYSARLRMIDARFSGVVWTPVVLVACAALLRTPGIAGATGFPPDQFPVTAYAHLPAEGRLLAPDKFGGYLIYRSAGTRKVFMDGRSDLYGATFLTEYGRMMAARPGWRAWFDSFGFTDALLPADSPLEAALESGGWQVAYRDGVATLLKRAEPRN